MISRVLGQKATSAAGNEMENKRLSWTSFLFDWMLGSAHQHMEDGVQSTVEPELLVEPPIDSNSWVESFNSAITEATTDFILRHVDPYHREDPSAGYAVRRLKVGFKDAAAPCLRAIQLMPTAMRDRIVLLRMKKAKGAEELSLDNFYGLSVLAEETLMDGQLVNTMVTFSGARFTLRFEFEGEYVSLPASMPLIQAVAPNSGRGSSAAVQSIKGLETDPPYPTDTNQAGKNADALKVTAFMSGRETPLARSGLSSTSRVSRETPLYRPTAPTRTPIVRLRLVARGASAAIDLFEDEFPYTVGRHPSAEGFSVRGSGSRRPEGPDASLLSQTQADEVLCYVSRSHLVLHAPDFESGDIRIDNLSAQLGKNGTFVNGVAQPPRFIYQLKHMVPLCLGGPDGDGILEAWLEAV